MGQRDRWLDPFQAVALERQGPEKRRTSRKRMNRRTKVVHKSRAGQLGRARPAADGGIGFEHSDRASGPGEGDRRRQAIWTRTHHNRIAFHFLSRRSLLLGVPFPWRKAATALLSGETGMRSF